MKVVVTKSYDESCAYVADMICKLVNEKPACKLGLATGGTPVPMYKKLIEANKAGKVDFSAVRTVNLDEYCGIPGTHDQSYRYFMDSNLFDHINIDKANTYVAKGMGDAQANAAELEAKVREGGAADLQLLGIGNNGHIAFNEPGDDFGLETHVVDLTESTIEANKRFFESRDEVPRHALSMGIKNIMNARRILMVVSGEEKADIVCKAFTGPVTKEVPASVLQLHPDVTLVGDKAALHKLVEAGVTVCG